MAQKITNLMLTILLATVLAASGCSSPQAGPGSRANAQVNAAALVPVNGAYLVIREASTPQDARTRGVPEAVLAYDRRKYSDAPANEPLTYVALDPTDYVPLIIEGVPEMQKDGKGLSMLTVSLTRENVERTEAFTRAHLGGRIAMVVDGEIVTLHKIRSVISGGKLQITRCTDNACEVIYAKLIK